MADYEQLLKSLLEDTNAGDVTIKYNGGERKILGSILEKRSDYFKALLDSQMVEGRTKVIELLNTSKDALDLVLHQLYLWKLPKSIMSNIFAEAYCLMHLWDIKELIEQYLHVAWTKPYLTLQRCMEKYPATERLCVAVAEQTMNRLTNINRNKEYFFNDGIEVTDDLTRKVIVHALVSGKITADDIARIVESEKKKSN
nr:hypothetical protein K-LCC10_0256 [Kaumoebavirus]